MGLFVNSLMGLWHSRQVNVYISLIYNTVIENPGSFS